jgi:galactokinase
MDEDCSFIRVDREKEVEIFVPGRLAIQGEHTDWACKYRAMNRTIRQGQCLLCATNEGIHAKVKFLKEDDNRLRYLHYSKGEFDAQFEDLGKLREEARGGGFFSYIAGTASRILEDPRYSSTIETIRHGISIENYATTLPVGKGLSSSAAICVLIARAFNELYGLDMDMNDVMRVAYDGEMRTPSQCGRMDQCVAMGKDSIALMEFHGCDEIRLTRIHNAQALFFVVGDLRAGKNTVRILKDLNACFPVPSSKAQAGIHSYVNQSSTLIRQAVCAIEAGDTTSLGKHMCAAQACFDHGATDICPSELTSPKLHSLMRHPELQRLSLAVKGVGSQGDGTVQILTKDKEQQDQVMRLLSEELDCEAFTLTIPPNPNDMTNPSSNALLAARPTVAVIPSALAKDWYRTSIHFEPIGALPAIGAVILDLIGRGFDSILIDVDQGHRNAAPELYKRLADALGCQQQPSAAADSVWSYADHLLDMVRHHTTFSNEPFPDNHLLVPSLQDYQFLLD